MKPIKLYYVFILAIISIFLNLITLGTVFIYSTEIDFFNSFLGQFLFNLRNYFNILLIITSLFNWLFVSTFIYYYLIGYLKSKEQQK